MYRQLVSQIDSARKNSAVFYKVDLHVHTYESINDFPKLGDRSGCSKVLTEVDRNPKLSDFIDAAKKAKLRVMAITDHNRSKVAEQMAALSDKDLLVLPGIEVSVKSHLFPDSVVHILAIFPENYSSADIDKVFSNGTMPIYSERKHDSVLEMSVGDFINSVRNTLKGICIASHVNSNKGLRTLFRESNVKLLRLEGRKRQLQSLSDRGVISTKEEEELSNICVQFQNLNDDIQNRFLLFLAENNFDAIEIQNSEHRQYYSGTHVQDLGIRPIACLINSDAHNLSDIGQVGYSTYIKMTKPSFKDLQKALHDPGTRIRFENEIHRPTVARILGIKFEGGYFQQHVLGFSDNLTCLIGGRGSGKSATIEALRYIFDLKSPSSDSEKQKDIKGRLDFTLRDSEIKVLFADSSGDQYVLKRRYGDSHTDCYDTEGNLHSEINIVTASNFKIKIYGWGEIEELAKNKRDQLDLIDGFIPNVEIAKDNVKTRLQELQRNTNRIISLATEIKNLLPKVAELPAKSERLKKLTSPELDTIFSSFDRNQNGQGAITTLRTAVDEGKKKFLHSDGSAYELDKALINTLTDVSEKLTTFPWFERYKLQVEELANNIQNDYMNLLDGFDNLTTALTEKSSDLATEENQIEIELNCVEENAESSDMKSILSRRKTLSEEVSELQGFQDQISHKNQELLELLSDRRNHINPSLNSARMQVTVLRQAKLTEINSQLRELTTTAKVEIQLTHQAERRSFLLALGTGGKKDPEGVLKGVNKHYIADKYAEHYSRKHSPHTFVNAILHNTELGHGELQISVIQEDGSTKDIIPPDRAEVVWKHLSPFVDDSTYYDPDKLKRLLELEHCDTEDLVQISLDGRSIEDLSPGQRCSALIPVILLESQNPLVIDQPEDNLDNKLVFNLVVDIIRGLKERRQIIMATHNPNIPVSGDAEQILVFETQTKEICEKIISGSIDCDEIIESVKAIMEGSEEAFRIRAEKYGYEIPIQAKREMIR